ncbi:MAG: hypothetical protein P8L44_07070 [Opitutales bacterium]|nr:hypothetical protein [Opitutales bacterium]
MISSDDGITWNRHNTGIREILTGEVKFSDAAYGNGLYVIITDLQGYVLVSPDLEDWTITRPQDLNNGFSSVYFHDGLFYFGGDGAIVASADGVNFTTIETPGFERVRSIIYADEQFVAVGDDALIITSPDGITWTSIIFEEDNSDFYSIGADDTHFYFPGTQGCLWKTPDFVTWEQLASGHNSILYGIISAEGQTVLTGTTGFIATSDDFETWTDRRIGYDSNFIKCAYAFDHFYVLNQRNGILKSSDGVTWTESYVPEEIVTWTNMTFADGKLVAIDRETGIVISEDGTNWSDPKYILGVQPRNDYAANIHYFDGLWYLIGTRGMFHSSPDLETWTDISLDPADDYRDLAYNGETFVLVGFNGNLFSSTDGVEWIDRNEGGSENFTGVSYDNGLFLLGVSGGVSPLYVSTDGIEWTPRTATSVPNSTSNIYFIEHQFVTGNTQGQVFLSPDTEYWRQGFLDVDLGPSCFCLADGKVVVGGGGNGLLMSGDLPSGYTLDVSSNGNGSVDVYPVLDTYP